MKVKRFTAQQVELNTGMKEDTSTSCKTIRLPTMGKDKHKTAATSETNTQDGHQDSQRDHSRDQEARDATLVPSLKQSQGRWQRLMCTTKLFSMREAQPPFKPALKYLQEQMVLRFWTPSIGQRTNLSTRDGNYGQKRLDSPLMLWREIQRKPRFLTSIIGSMEKEWDTLSHGKQQNPPQPVSI